MSVFLGVFCYIGHMKTIAGKGDAPYYYDLPPELVAMKPIEPRHAARLMIYDTAKDEVHFDTFLNIASYLPKNSAMVFNDTRVIPARIPLIRPRGGKVDALFLVNEIRDTASVAVPALMHKRVPIGEVLFFSNGEGTDASERISFTVLSYEAGTYMLEAKRHVDSKDGRTEGVPSKEEDLSWSALLAFLNQYGRMPLPPYIDSPLNEEERRTTYQTVFARRHENAENVPKEQGSVAAPTASLHFDEAVFANLDRAGIARTMVSLHVGRGTFLPVRPEQIAKGELHKEWYVVPQESVQALHDARSQGKRIVAVGTTVTRTLESAKDALLGNAAPGKKEIVDATTMFIQPGYQFAMVDTLVTNFHLADSSLMYLVDAFLQHKGARRSILELYALAIEKKFRFFSFGDGMLIL